MKRKLITLAAALGALTLHAESSPSELSKQALLPDSAIAREAQDRLRAMGPKGLLALSAEYYLEHSGPVVSDVEEIRMRNALNRVSAQYDSYASMLYWYTDLEKAKEAAAKTGRPILSLRLLGKLDTDLSCANSRLFRTTLYPDGIVNRILRERFVLHWESVRPVPVMTIDFGDGRKLVRTITGNSIHYVLDSQGRVIDALPSLYSAEAFARELNKTADSIAAFKSPGPDEYAKYQKRRLDEILRSWSTDMEKIGSPVEERNIGSLIGAMDEKKWKAIASLHPTPSSLSTGTVYQLVASKFPTAKQASFQIVSKTSIETPLLGMLTKLGEDISIDTLLADYMHRTRILAFLSSQGSSMPLASINDWIYSEVFLTPTQDPWLGLSSARVFAAIDNNGEINEQQEQLAKKLLFQHLIFSSANSTASPFPGR